MFFFLAMLATLGYSAQGTLMVAVYRRMDTLSAVSYRGLSLGVVMLPLLLWMPEETWNRTPEVLTPLLCAATITAFGNWCMGNAMRFLPVGTASTLCMGLAAVVTALHGFFFFGERLTPLQIFCGSLILLGGLALGISRAGPSAPPDYNIPKGLLNTFLFGLLLGTGFVLMGGAARKLHPLLAGYLWEFLIGIIALAVIPLRQWFGHGGLARVNFPQFLEISWRSAPTAVGTGCYAFAVTQGPFAIATAIISTTMVLNTILAAFLYHEKLRPAQWLLILLVCIMTIFLKLVS